LGRRKSLQTVAEGKGELYCAQACFAVVSLMVWKGMI